MTVPRKETAIPDSLDGQSAADNSVESLPRGSKNRLWISILKASTVLLFLCALCGAFVYAINNSGQNEKQKKERNFNSSDPFTPLKDQYSANGNYVFKFLTPLHVELVYTHETFWYQDDDKAEIVFKMDNSTVIWVFANTTFWAQIDSAGQPVKCDEDPTVGYANFFVELSLSEMYNRHSEMRKIKGDTEVFLFEGYPTEWKHQNVQPFLVQAYAAKDDGRLMGFQSHYDADINGGWSLLGYNFDDMKASKPPKHLYSSLPSMCEPDSK